MEDSRYDPYYRNFPSNVVPVRTPFTRSGRNDAGYVFFYLTHRKPNWSLLLEKTRMEDIYEEARARIPKNFTQFLLLEKRYSTPKPQSRAGHPRRPTPAPPPPSQISPQPRAKTQVSSFSNTLIVLREPDPIFTRQGDILSYHLREDEAIAAAESYTRLNNRRAIVGLLLWDERWY